MKDTIEMYSDGGSRGNPGYSAAAFVIFKNGKEIVRNGRYLGKKTNNQAEYFSLIMGLNWIVQNDVYSNAKKIDVFMDSELVIKQATGLYKIKKQEFLLYFDIIKAFKKLVKVSVNFHHIKREGNKIADGLVNKILDEKT